MFIFIYILYVFILFMCIFPSKWTYEHDQMLIREMLLFEPWNVRHESPERGGQVWKRIAESLNSLHIFSVKVDDRAVRYRFKILEKKFQKKESDERKLSGIAPPEETEIEQGIRDCLECFDECDKHTKADMENKKNEKWTVTLLKQRNLEIHL